MLILTSEQISFVHWQLAHSDCETLAECMGIYAMLETEGLAECAEGNHCDDMRGVCVFCSGSIA